MKIHTKPGGYISQGTGLFVLVVVVGKVRENGLEISKFLGRKEVFLSTSQYISIVYKVISVLSVE